MYRFISLVHTRSNSHDNSRNKSRSTARRGITLLEIMISIGVVGIGLIGVASLIPLAHYKAGQGVREDRKAQFGKRAYREFFVQGFDQPGSMANSNVNIKPYWLQLAPGNMNGIYTHRNPLLVPPLITGPAKNQTYCFDPLWIAARNELGSRVGVPVSYQFPDLMPNGVNFQVPRITVRQQNLNRYSEWRYGQVLAATGDPNNANSQAYNGMFALSISANPVAMSLAQANEIFRLRDDFDTKKVTDPLQSEFAVPVSAPGATTTYLQRTYLRQTPTGPGSKSTSAGTFSWMATLVPEISLWNTVVAPPIPLTTTNRYQLSVVVFYQRDLTGQYQEEVVANVDGPSAVLVGPTKQISVIELPTPPVTPNNVSVRNIRGGDWVALVQNPTPPAAFDPFAPNYMRLQWYQVTAADELDNDADTVRDLTLNGPDWKSISRLPIYLIYMRNVATVYEKTISLQ